MSEDEDDETFPEDGPTVELGLYELSVTVEGAPDDDLDEVREAATESMEFLVQRHFDVEDGPDDRDRY